MSPTVEYDFEPGHPKRFDFDPASPEAQEWARIHLHPRGERDFPVDHPKALDTKGNENSVRWSPGVDPRRSDLEPFTGRTPRQAKAAADMARVASSTAKETPVFKPVDAAKANAALAAERKKLGVDFLDFEQTMRVLNEL